MTSKQLAALGFAEGKTFGVALKVARDAEKTKPTEQVEQELADVLVDPDAYTDDAAYGELAVLLMEPAPIEARAEPVPYAQWGRDLDDNAVKQMDVARRLPVAVSSALMPDAHLGYGLPIGGVLATDNAVIPYAVGVDIACRMRLTVFDVPADQLDGMRGKLTNALQRETRFGMGAKYNTPNDHAVMDADWDVSPVTKRFKDKARSQLGSSGSGNHFVEFGELTLDEPDLGMQPGKYLALLSHSGSRGTGASVCDHYSKLAMKQCATLPKEMRHLAWLDLDSDTGREYWDAMNLMGDYAAANHEVIHRLIAKAINEKLVAEVENHHNFAWKEEHDGREVIVHRKGATPAGQGVLGIIPGSMAAPGFVVRGRGNAQSLRSASHGAGRVMSRKQAANTFRWNHVKADLEAAGVTLLSAGIDENPRVYKDIHTVMAQQTDLVDIVARFDPKIVKMADAGEKPED
ncbi:MAG: RtcB family protein [Planctomycetota bacterium]